jgi:4-cresol dehydrogenase (hydroxylating)
VISFDRDVADEERRARDCHDEMLRRLMAAGYPPIRLGIQSMQAGLPSDPGYAAVIRRLKSLFDPNDVIAPGHYDFHTT